MYAKDFLVLNMNVKDIDGDYSFKLAGNDYKLSISGSTSKPKAKLESGDKSLGAKMSYANDWVNLTFKTADSTKKVSKNATTNKRITTVASNFTISIFSTPKRLEH